MSSAELFTPAAKLSIRARAVLFRHAEPPSRTIPALTEFITLGRTLSRAGAGQEL